MYCCKKMVKILKYYLIPKKSYGILSKGAIFFGQPCFWRLENVSNNLFALRKMQSFKVFGNYGLLPQTFVESVSKTVNANLQFANC